MIIGGRGRAFSRSDGISGNAVDGAGPGEGRLRRESREGRRGGGKDEGAMGSEGRRYLLKSKSGKSLELLHWIHTEEWLQNRL